MDVKGEFDKVVDDQGFQMKVIKDEICRQYPIYKVLDVP